MGLDITVYFPLFCKWLLANIFIALPPICILKSWHYFYTQTNQLKHMGTRWCLRLDSAGTLWNNSMLKERAWHVIWVQVLQIMPQGKASARPSPGLGGPNNWSTLVFPRALTLLCDVYSSLPCKILFKFYFKRKWKSFLTTKPAHNGHDIKTLL